VADLERDLLIIHRDVGGDGLLRGGIGNGGAPDQGWGGAGRATANKEQEGKQDEDARPGRLLVVRLLRHSVVVRHHQQGTRQGIWCG
jgi:hypothetical protein